MFADILLRLEAGLLPFGDEVPSDADHVPRDLIGDIPDFVGRTAYIERLDGILDESKRQESTVVVSAVSGAPGAGKTALALHWAHSVRSRFPGGDLYVDLRGYSPTDPVDPREVLATLLRRLGADSDEIPSSLDERAAEYRSRLSQRRVLIVADNARNSQQVKWLLPGDGSSLLFVTSRDTLTLLRDLYGARTIHLSPMLEYEAVDLLRELLGSRIDDDSQAIKGIAETCSYLPLALRIVAGVILDSPDSSLSELRDELAAERLLYVSDESDDPRLSLQAAFSWSYRTLGPDVAGLFRALGLLPGEDAGVYAAAAALDVGEAEARRRLRALRRASLVEEPRRNRFKMHDMLKAYAGEVAYRELSNDERAGITIRILDYYLYTANSAMDALYPGERDMRPQIPSISTPVPDVSSREVARQWVDEERANLIAAALSSENREAYIITYSAVLHRDLEVTGYYDDGAAIHEAARKRALARNDRLAEAGVNTRLSVMKWRLDDYDGAAECLQATIQATEGDESARANMARTAALGNLSLVHAQREDWQEAIMLGMQALEASLVPFRPLGVAFALTNIGTFFLASGDPGTALPILRRALKVHRDCENPNGVAITLGSIAEAYIDLGMYVRSERSARRALAIHRSEHDREGEGRMQNGIAAALNNMGRYEEALECASKAVETHKALKNKKGQATALVNQGNTLNRLGRPDEALDRLKNALALAEGFGDPILQGDALATLGDSMTAIGHLEQAHERWRRALALYRQVATTTRRDRKVEELTRQLAA